MQKLVRAAGSPCRPLLYEESNNAVTGDSMSFCPHCGSEKPAQPKVRGDLTISNSRAWWQGQAVKLTPTQFKILVALVNASPNTLSRDQIADLALYPESAVKTIDVHVSRIRIAFRKIEMTFDQLETRSGFGYRWRV